MQYVSHWKIAGQGNKKKIALVGHINVSKIKWFICQNNLKGALADAVFSIEIMSI